AEENKKFDISNVLNAICDKLIHRHPHIYGDVKVTSEEEVKKNWEKLKLKEGKKSILDGVPNSLPALVKAGRIQEKVAQYGFEWNDIEDVWNKVKEEVEELKLALDSGNKKNIEEEFGDVLFSLVNYARFIDVNSENALAIVNKKFITRFNYIEKKAKNINKSIDKMTLEEMEKLWEESKTAH
ncbi:MAG TPA: nucleoside triphosphate pyrophosphohydrolase, partial [Bacteroidetes bacterium]|nr:nucleoside triphosphate pyrophosphohydrolase [Bacteroidota bacterium]